MKIKFRKGVVEDQKHLDYKQFREIEEEIEETAKEGLDRPNTKLVPNPKIEHPVWQMTVEKEKTNHKVYLDINDGNLVVLAIWSFEYTHRGDQHWDRLDDRM